MPFLGHFEDVKWIQALGHFDPVGCSPWVQRPDHQLKRQLGYRCHQVIVHCAQACSSEGIGSHLQESAEVMLLIGVWVHTQAYTLRAANFCGRGPGGIIAKIPQLGATDGGSLPVDRLGWHLGCGQALQSSLYRRIGQEALGSLGSQSLGEGQ